jgi:hypothetical protein
MIFSHRKLNQAKFTFLDPLFPWIAMIGLLGLLAAWLVVTIIEHTGLVCYVWHLPLFFLAVVVIFISVIGMLLLP